MAITITLVCLFFVIICTFFTVKWSHQAANNWKKAEKSWKKAERDWIAVSYWHRLKGKSVEESRKILEEYKELTGENLVDANR